MRIGDALIIRHLELRRPDGGFLRVLASDAPKLHGLTPSLAVVDELGRTRSWGFISSSPPRALTDSDFEQQKAKILGS
jgi:hypothetical protein